jgi:ubiquinone/menaquinone biosynthesis C-methylase UbiE
VNTKKVWDSLSSSQVQASEAATGLTDEQLLVTAGRKCAEDLIELVEITETDEVLEIGCGVGRVDLILSTRCRSWTGADISSNMLRHAAGRLAGLSNVTLVHLSGMGLVEMRSESFDVIYSTNVFAHIDELDRWRYVEEGFRVLRPGGRIYVDNVDLEDDSGWSLFLTDYDLI